jgi:hypothetical protein
MVESGGLAGRMDAAWTQRGGGSERIREQNQKPDALDAIAATLFVYILRYDWFLRSTASGASTSADLLGFCSTRVRLKSLQLAQDVTPDRDNSFP